MAKSFDLVKVEGFETLASAIRNNVSAARQDVSNYLLSNLQHFHVNGKKVDVLQEAIDTILSVRFRDLDVVEIALRALTPLEFNTESKEGVNRKKWINIIGEKVAKDQGDPKKVKTQDESNRAKWANSFGTFAKGELFQVGNHEFFKGCNDGLKEGEAGWITEKVEKDFSQDIYSLVDCLKDIQVLKQKAKAARDNAPSDTVEALSLSVGTIKKSMDSLAKKANESLDKVTADYINNATVAELDNLDGYGDEMEQKIAILTAKLADMRSTIATAKQAAADREQAAKDEAVLAQAAAIMAARADSAQVQETTVEESAA